MSNHDEEIIKLVKRYANVGEVEADKSLDYLGIDSLAKVELLGDIEEQYNVHLDHQIYFETRTPAEISKQLENTLHATNS